MGLTFSYWVLLIPYSTIDSHAAITGIRRAVPSLDSIRNCSAATLPQHDTFRTYTTRHQ
jgi:hypothetical protein